MSIRITINPESDTKDYHRVNWMIHDRIVDYSLLSLDEMESIELKLIEMVQQLYNYRKMHQE
jgi:hypothetical protein